VGIVAKLDVMGQAFAREDQICSNIHLQFGYGVNASNNSNQFSFQALTVKYEF
jgi:hypothetical protein